MRKLVILTTLETKPKDSIAEVDNGQDSTAD